MKSELIMAAPVKTSSALDDIPLREPIPDEKELMQLLAAFDSSRIREAFALLKLAEQYGYDCEKVNEAIAMFQLAKQYGCDYKKVNEALRARKTHAQKCAVYFATHKEERRQYKTEYQRMWRKMKKEQAGKNNQIVIPNDLSVSEPHE